MKFTFNHLNNWRKTSSIWRHIDELPEKRFRREIGMKDRFIPYCNIIYYKLHCEFIKKFGCESFYLREFYDLFTGERLPVDELRSQHLPYVYIHTSISMFTWDIEFTITGLKQHLKQNEYSHSNSHDWNSERRYSIRMTGNQIITDSLIESAVFDYINLHVLYKDSRFRNAQRELRMDRVELKKLYKNSLEKKILYTKSTLQDYDVDMKRIIKKRYGFDPQLHVNNWQKFIGFCIKNQHRSRNEIIPIINEPNLYSMLDGFDGDIDELEEVYREEMSQYPSKALFYSNSY